MFSPILKLHLEDLFKGAVAAVIGAGVAAASQVVSNCTTFACITGLNWAAIGQSALLVGVSYLLKNLLTDSNGNVLGIQIKKGAN